MGRRVGSGKIGFLQVLSLMSPTLSNAPVLLVQWNNIGPILFVLIMAYISYILYIYLK